MWWVWANCEEHCLPSPSTGRVKLIRVWLGVADGLSALLSVCIRGSQPLTVLLPPPQHHSTHCQPCLDCTSLSSLPLSSTLLFSQLFLYVCHSVSRTLTAPWRSLIVHPEEFFQPVCQSTSPASFLPSSYWTFIFCILPLKILLMIILPTQNVAGSCCFSGIQMIWCFCINCL